MPETHPFTLQQLREQQTALRNKHQGTSGQPTELPAAYAAKLNAQPQPLSVQAYADRLMHRPQKATPQLLDYATARRLTWAIMRATLEQRRKTITIDDTNRPVIVQLVKWFICDPTCELDLQKGIFLTGSVGTGKTFLLDTMQALTLAAKLPTRHFRTARCVDVAELIRTQNTPDPKAATKSVAKLEHLHHGAWCFDDLGHEPLSVKVWGDERHVMEPILSRRYNQFVQGDCITHATSNLGKDKLREFYGDRLADRFNEMFNFILLDGDSRRK